MTLKNKQIILAERPTGMPDAKTFKIVESEIGELSDGQVLVRTLYVSVDPYMRGRMHDAESYIEPFQLHHVIEGGAVGEVIESRSTQFKKGDRVIGMFGWQEYAAVDGQTLRKIDSSLAPITAYLGVLGMTGLTAYFGLMEIGQPKEGETVVVSGAAGAVGSMVGQIAKIHGARVVGIAGSEDKIRYLMQELHFDAVINYRTAEDLEQEVREACPDGVDVYFDNVGGEISDAVITRLNRFARIPVCGAISAYNAEQPEYGPRVQPTLIKKSALMQGFIVSNYAKDFATGIMKLSEWLREGKLTYRESVKEGFENIPEAFLDLFHGNNIGKQLVNIADF